VAINVKDVHEREIGHESREIREGGERREERGESVIARGGMDDDDGQSPDATCLASRR
jgi:hypothetical protein